MKSYVWVAFGFMGWTYYEMSGGAEFVPEERPVAVVAQVEETPLDDVVARADTAVLQSISTSNVTIEPQQAEITNASLETEPTFTEAEVTEALEAALDLQDLEPAPEQEPLAARMADIVVTPVETSGGDIRQVSGSRVNMRTGPGTNFGVIDTLAGGTQVRVLEVDANGWARLIDLDTGAEGWMAERLLTNPT